MHHNGHEGDSSSDKEDDEGEMFLTRVSMEDMLAQADAQDDIYPEVYESDDDDEFDPYNYKCEHQEGVEAMPGGTVPAMGPATHVLPDARPCGTVPAMSADAGGGSGV